jgi:hypothetical protein
MGHGVGDARASRGDGRNIALAVAEIGGDSRCCGCCSCEEFWAESLGLSVETGVNQFIVAVGGILSRDISQVHF